MIIILDAEVVLSRWCLGISDHDAALTAPRVPGIIVFRIYCVVAIKLLLHGGSYISFEEQLSLFL